MTKILFSDDIEFNDSLELAIDDDEEFDSSNDPFVLLSRKEEQFGQPLIAIRELIFE